MGSKFVLFALFFSFVCSSQTLKGKIIDRVTQQPIETASVYFDNTTIGTTTNEKGEFSITYTDATQSTLIISYLGYEKVFVSNYRDLKILHIELSEASSALDEVYLEYDDGLTRKQKLRLFRKEFLGTSKFGRSCKILNEEDLILRYNKTNKVLFASSKIPIKIENKALQYEVSFEIIDFELNYKYVDIEKRIFNLKYVTYMGTSFFKDLNYAKKRKVIKNRESAYNGSIQHFMRALYNKQLKEEDYLFGKKGFKVDPYDYFTIYNNEKFGYKTVVLKEKLDIFYKGTIESIIETKVQEFKVDKYGNYSPIPYVLFGGALGKQRLGDTLPSDYGLNN